MSLSLAELKVGEKAKIIGFTSEPSPYQHRLLALGFTPQTEFTVVRVAPLGDPVELKIHQSSVCLRKQQAKILRLERA